MKPSKILEETRASFSRLYRLSRRAPLGWFGMGWIYVRLTQLGTGAQPPKKTKPSSQVQNHRAKASSTLSTNPSMPGSLEARGPAMFKI